MNEPRTRRSFLTVLLTRAAGLFALAAGGAAAVAGCVVKYGGPPEDWEEEPVAKYGGPSEDGGCVESADAACEPDAGPAPKYGGPVDGGY